MLLVINPVPLVLGSIGVSVLSISMGFVIFPLAVVDVTVGVDQSASSVCFVIFPVAFVNTSIAPDLVASAVTLFRLNVPLSLVLGSVGEHHHRPLLLLDTWLVVFIVVPSVLEFRETFSDSLDSGSLFFKLLRVHFNMNSSPHEETLAHFKAIDLLDHAASKEAPDERLHVDDSAERDLIESLPVLPALGLIVSSPVPEVSLFVFLGFVGAASTHFILKY